jgi:hypothetical protein
LDMRPRVDSNGAYLRLWIGLVPHKRTRFRIVQLALKRLCIGMLLVIVLALMPPPTLAQDVSGFRSPTGNIHCQYSGGDDPTVRCDLREMSNRPPPRPADCDLDWGKAFEISANATAGTRLCYGDTVQNDGLPVLPYGQQFRRQRILCTSSEEGVECRNSNGYGFKIARASQTLW